MLAEVHKTRDDVKLVLVGQGSSKDYLVQKAQDLNLSDYLILTGYRSDVRDLLFAADIAVPSSKREGLGLNVIEAMACKIPVVAYDNRGHRSIISNGESGFLVPNGDYKAMAEKVNFLLDNSDICEKMTENAFQELYQYSDEHVLKLMREIYMSIM